jgi:hypothetical protein
MAYFFMGMGLSQPLLVPTWFQHSLIKVDWSYAMKCKEYIITSEHKEYDDGQIYSVFYTFEYLSYSMNIWLAHNQH